MSKMYQTTCDKCGDSCQVPFIPTSGKPVYCSSCFSASKGKSGTHRERRSDTSRREQTMHKATCANCGKECQVPFKPNQDKPVYCNACFGNKGEAHKARQNLAIESIEKKLDLIDKKLDQLISLSATQEQ